jgi:beta-phosphoglucomutase family hydrolase
MLEIPPHVRGLVFDCDGTIADTMPLHYQAWTLALKEHGKDFSEAMFYEMAGIPTRRIFEILNEKHHYNLPIDECTERKEQLFTQLIPQVVAIEPVVELVHQFTGKLPMAVATGGTRSICLKTLQALGIEGLFQALVTADDVVHGKPSPDIFLEAARQLGVLPGLCCAFEDAELGLQAARAAGMLVIDIRPAHRASLELKSLKNV